MITLKESGIPRFYMAVETPPEPDVDHLWFPYYGDCWMCGKPTTWWELNFECALCPGVCTDESWEFYRKATEPARCWMKTGFVTGERYCGQHGRAAGWPCKALDNPFD